MRRVPLKHIAAINRVVLPESTSPDFSFGYIDIGSVSSTGALSIPDTLMSFAEAPSRARRLAPRGATIISTVRTYLRAIARVPPAQSRLVFSTGFAVLEPGRQVDAGYLYYACRADSFVDEVVATSTGVSYPAINPSDLGSISIPVPPLEKQRRISDFLDDQVALLERGIALRQVQQALATERFESLLARACTLTGRRTVRLKALAWYREGPGILAADFRESGTPVIRLAGVKPTTVTLEGCNFVDPSQAARQWAHLVVRAGELLVSGSAGTRFPVVVPAAVDGAIPYTGLIRVSPRDGRLSRDFLRYFMGSPVFHNQADRLKTGIGVQHWGPFHLGQVEMPSLDRGEQDRLVQQLQVAEHTHRELTSLQGRHMALLQERKAALITAAVTGQLDVTTARSAA